MTLPPSEPSSPTARVHRLAYRWTLTELVGRLHLALGYLALGYLVQQFKAVGDLPPGLSATTYQARFVDAIHVPPVESVRRGQATEPLRSHHE